MNNNNKVDCKRLKAAFLEFKKMLGDSDKNAQMWHWLFDSAIKCHEYGMAREVIEEMPVRMRIEAMTTLAVESGEKEYVKEVIELAWKEIKTGNDSGYSVLARVIESMVETEKEKVINWAIKEAERIDDSVHRNSMLNAVIKIVSGIKERKAKALGHSVPEDSKIREEIFSLTVSETKALVAASRA